MPHTSTFLESSDDDIEYVSNDLKSVPNDELSRSAHSNTENNEFYDYILPQRRPDSPPTTPEASLSLSLSHSLVIMEHKATNTTRNSQHSQQSSHMNDVESRWSDFDPSASVSSSRPAAQQQHQPPSRQSSSQAMLSQPLSFTLFLTDNTPPANSQPLRPGIYLVQSEKVIVSNHAIRTLVKHYQVKHVAQFKIDLKIEYNNKSGLAIKNKPDYFSGLKYFTF